MHTTALSLRKRLIAFLTRREVIVVIFILGCVFQLGSILLRETNVINPQRRIRTLTQIAALGTALESYKIDNGTYPLPIPGTSTMPDAATQPDPATYAESARLLFRSLSGRANFGSAPVEGLRVYYPFKRNEIKGLSDTIAADAWGNPLGYNSQNPHYYPNHYDLWSTGGGKLATDRDKWIGNFK